jgi:hypothetical protein
VKLQRSPIGTGLCAKACSRGSESTPGRSRAAKVRCSAFQFSVSFVITDADNPGRAAQELAKGRHEVAAGQAVQVGEMARLE